VTFPHHEELNMPVTETIERTTVGEITRVQALMEASTQRLAEHRKAIEAAEAARKEAVRHQALGGGDAPGLAAAVRKATEALAEARQALADEEEGNAALKAEGKRLRDVLAAEQAAAKRAEVERIASEATTCAEAVERSLVQFLADYAVLDGKVNDLLRASPKLSGPIADLRLHLIAAVLERASHMPGLPFDYVGAMRHPTGPRYMDKTIPQLVGPAERFATWHSRGGW
jgi:hypothetical protein